MTATHETVEQLVRSKLSEALGGRRGIIESAVPTVLFTVMFVSTHDLRLSLATEGRAWTCMGPPMVDEVLRLRRLLRR